MISSDVKCEIIEYQDFGQVFLAPFREGEKQKDLDNRT